MKNTIVDLTAQFGRDPYAYALQQGTGYASDIFTVALAGALQNLKELDDVHELIYVAAGELIKNVALHALALDTRMNSEEYDIYQEHLDKVKAYMSEGNLPAASPHFDALLNLGNVPIIPASTELAIHELML